MNFRSRELLDLAAHELPCQFQIPGICTVSPGVFCHSNEQGDGKGLGIKAHDCLAALGCVACHRWYDIGPSPRAEKREVFGRALKRTLVLLFTEGYIGVLRGHPVTQARERIERMKPLRRRKSQCTASSRQVQRTPGVLA